MAEGPTLEVVHNGTPLPIFAQFCQTLSSVTECEGSSRFIQICGWENVTVTPSRDSANYDNNLKLILAEFVSVTIVTVTRAKNRVWGLTLSTLPM